MMRDESFDIANEVRQSFAVEERLFSLCHAEGKSFFNNEDTHRRRVKIVHGLPLLMQNGCSSYGQLNKRHVGYRTKMAIPKWAIELKHFRTPDPYYTSKQYFFRTFFVKRKGVWWLLEMNADTRKEKNLISLLYHLKKKLKFLCRFFFLLNLHILRLYHNSHLKLFCRIVGTFHGSCTWQ